MTRREIWIVLGGLVVCGGASFFSYSMGVGHGWDSGRRFGVKMNCISVKAIESSYGPPLGTETPAFKKAYEEVCTKQMEIQLEK